MARETSTQTGTRLAYGAGRRILNLVAGAGARSRSIGAAAEPVTIAALGDSLTQGYGLPEAEGFVPQLQAWLRANGAPDVVVVNAGVSGDTTAGGLARVDWTLTDDDRRGDRGARRATTCCAASTRPRPGATSTASCPRSARAACRCCSPGCRRSANFGTDYQAAFDAIYPELAAAHGAILYPNFLAGLGDGRDLNAVRALMQADGIHPNAEGVAAVVAAIGPSALALVVAAQQD